MEPTKTRTEEISSFTLAQLVDICGGESERLLSKGCLTASSNAEQCLFRYPCRIDALIIGLCTEGEAELSINLKSFRLRRNSLFIYTPKNIIEHRSVDLFHNEMLAVTPEFMQRINIDIKRMMPLLLRYGDHPCIELSEEESRLLRSFIAQVDREINGPDTPFSQNVVDSLISATIYKMCDILSHHIEQQPEQETPIRSRNEYYFKEFMRLLGEHYKVERSVAFYAQRLCITPKYLTTLIKRVSGKSVSEWIDAYVILEAKTLLKSSNMSIQEIAYYLNFPNQSFFGCYFKRHAGLSPSQYKLKS